MASIQAAQTAAANSERQSETQLEEIERQKQETHEISMEQMKAQASAKRDQINVEGNIDLHAKQNQMAQTVVQKMGQ